MDITEVKALIFDVFGTVVDWRSSIIQHGKQFGRLHGVEADWDAFADDWRGKYAPFMNKVRHGELPWTNLDGLHRMSLEEVLSAYNITGLSDEAKAEFNLAWHNLQPWPDSVPGLYRLKHRFIIAPMSNGNVALMTNMAKNGGLPWDCILGAELARHYKPDPESYLTAVELLSLQPQQVMMVAAQPQRLERIVRDQQHSPRIQQFGSELLVAVAGDRIESGEWLVHQHDLAVFHQCPRQRNPLALTA